MTGVQTCALPIYKYKLRNMCNECRRVESSLYYGRGSLRNSKQYSYEYIKKEREDPYGPLKKYLLKLTKSGAKRKNLEHFITIDDIHIPEKCPLLGINFSNSYEYNVHDKYTYSIDRIDNTKGYIPGNIAVITRLANTMKNSATNVELLNFAKNINSYIKR